MPRCFQVDAFTDTPFTGNPAAVVLLDEPREEAWMQSVAAEMNLSETAFAQVSRRRWPLRWFTPSVEIDLCGHATLATAHVLWEQGLLGDASEVEFETLSGTLSARRSGRLIELDFPLDPPAPAEPDPTLIDALGFIPLACAIGRRDWLVEIASEPELRSVRPDFTAMRRVRHPSGGLAGVIVTARAAGDGCDFVSRFFGSAMGIDEDPVTGSAHCTLGPYWGRRLGKWSLSARQVSPRGGRIDVRVGGERAYLSGSAVTILRGDLAS